MASRVFLNASRRFLMASHVFLNASRPFLMASRVFLNASRVFLMASRPFLNASGAFLMDSLLFLIVVTDTIKKAAATPLRPASLPLVDLCILPAIVSGFFQGPDVFPRALFHLKVPERIACFGFPDGE